MELAVNGSPAYAYTGGKAFDPALPVVVLIHGAQQDHSCWHLQARSLAYHGRAVLAPDLPGHGRSAGPPLPSVEAISAWVLALMDAVGVDRAALVGHSMGSLVALETAGSHPGRVTRLVLVSTAVPMPVDDDGPIARRDQLDADRERPLRPFALHRRDDYALTTRRIESNAPPSRTQA